MNTPFNSACCRAGQQCAGGRLIHKGKPCAEPSPKTTADRAIVEPTDRSMPAVRMISVIGRASRASSQTCVDNSICAGAARNAGTEMLGLPRAASRLRAAAGQPPAAPRREAATRALVWARESDHDLAPPLRAERRPRWSASTAARMNAPWIARSQIRRRLAQPQEDQHGPHQAEQQRGQHRAEDCPTPPADRGPADHDAGDDQKLEALPHARLDHRQAGNADDRCHRRQKTSQGEDEQLQARDKDSPVSRAASGLLPAA